MIPTSAVEIPGHDGLLRWDVEGYERSAPQNIDDANWLICVCSVKVNGVSGQVRLSLTTRDFSSFCSDLERACMAVSGGAKFTTPEDGVKLEVNFRSTGSAEVKGTLRDGQNSITFSFDTDQTLLSQTVRELRKVLARFPVRK